MTNFKFGNAPKNPKWNDFSDGYQTAQAFDSSGGYFLAIRDDNKRLVKEDFYTTAGGRRKALQRFIEKVSK